MHQPPSPRRNRPRSSHRAGGPLWQLLPPSRPGLPRRRRGLNDCPDESSCSQNGRRICSSSSRSNSSCSRSRSRCRSSSSRSSRSSSWSSSSSRSNKSSRSSHSHICSSVLEASWTCQTSHRAVVRATRRRGSVRWRMCSGPPPWGRPSCWRLARRTWRSRPSPSASGPSRPRPGGWSGVQRWAWRLAPEAPSAGCARSCMTSSGVGS
mmetsp:Transcript_71245/g.231470  ORF Transcript_71245/g.231470 Transcript_71245/m.231470 type:complete len:208 (-) Transcript_71245:987-1610(-)